MSLSQSIKKRFAHVPLAHCPTPLERMDNLSKAFARADGEINLWIKRDDCTGLGGGGNKARQLEFYAGAALEQSADTLLTTGAVQSNHVRMTVAAARKLGMHCEIQYESRVANRPVEYYRSGNPFLVHMMGAIVHTYPSGEDEEGADRALYKIADNLIQQGKSPYVVPLAPSHPPIGALGYMLAAEELLEQAGGMEIHSIVLASGSGTTHSGLLTGLRALGSQAKITGICVRRSAELQKPRVLERCKTLCKMLDLPELVDDGDVLLDDAVLAPGYGALNSEVYRAIFDTAGTEGLLLDPTYTGKAMAGLFTMLESNQFEAGENIVFLHTGGLPGAFGYPELMDYAPSIMSR
jgi:L-cysteate sulfo-lyase